MSEAKSTQSINDKLKSGSKKETKVFESDVKQLLHLLAHSLYSNKEIFLRELISNASDAAEKLRMEALGNDKLYEGDADPRIQITMDADKNELVIVDNGIGMSRDELVENLGTIARSGTKAFINQLSKDSSDQDALIGQFGVGFYSVFVVADKVSVETRRAGLASEEGVRWTSDGEGEYTLEAINKAERGTKITLHLRDEEKEFLQDYRLRQIVSRYSDHINIPVEMIKPIAATDASAEESDEENAEPKAESDAPEFEAVNQAKALWTLNKSEVSEEQYKEFYKHVSHDFEDPLAWSHNKVEGKLEYTTLLYVPKRAPFGLFMQDQKHGLKLYVRRVFIMDEAEQFLPRYLRFMKGVVDSKDLPLNVSRELLQDNKTIDAIKASCTKRTLKLLAQMAEKNPEDYQAFWQAFGAVIKEGPGEDHQNKEEIAKLLRFASTQSDSEEQTVSLQEYVDNMQEGQEGIYYITAESYATAKNSPHLEVFKKKGIEVLLLSDRVDEWLVAHLTEFAEKKLISVTKGDLDLGDLDSEEEKEQQKATEKDFESVIKQIKDALGEQVEDVRVTHRLTSSPACIVASQDAMSENLKRMLKDAGQDVPVTKPILELNLEHSLVSRLKDEQSDDRFKQWSQVLLGQAMLAEGGQLEDPASFVQQMNALLEGV